MQILLSILVEPEKISNINNFFVVYDTNAKKIIGKFKLNNLINNHNNTMTRGTGMCYHTHHWYGACIAKEHRIGSKLIITNYKTGQSEINNLSLTKAVHGISVFGKQGSYTMILANSTQNDIISIITTHGTKVITEDVYFDFLTQEERTELDWNKEYKFDDAFHANDVYVHNKSIYTCMFFDYKRHGQKIFRHWRKDLKKSNVGAIYDIKNHKKIIDKIDKPHSIIVDSKNNIIFCESGTFSVVNVTKNTKVKLNGFTRGICEDKQKGGYWVGLSYHRKFSTKIKGVVLQFISYDMIAEDPIDLSQLGKEVFDIIPFRKGKWRLI